MKSLLCLRSRVGHRAQDNFWGAQATRLSFSAACRKPHRTIIAKNSLGALKVVGKLPTTTG
jgi:hypothetical protein